MPTREGAASAIEDSSPFDFEAQASSARDELGAALEVVGVDLSPELSHRHGLVVQDSPLNQRAEDEVIPRDDSSTQLTNLKRSGSRAWIHLATFRPGRRAARASDSAVDGSEISGELVALVGELELGESAHLELTNALARDVEARADLFEGVGAIAADAESELEDLALSLG